TAENSSTEVIVARGEKIPINTVLNKRYKLFKDLATGAFGATYLAEDSQKKPHHPQSVVLVKQLYPSNTNQQYLELARRLFNNEAKFLERLGKHDRIPQFIAFFEENLQFFIVEEFIKGHSLSAEINQGKKLSAAQVTQIITDVLEVLIFVHDHQIIHRDIKPDNLIRREQDQRIVLIDFGAIKQIQPQQLDNQTVSIGTIGYAPPEQVGGFPRFNSDIYALGIIGIQALTDMNPREFHREHHTGEIVLQNLSDASLQHWSKITAVSPELAVILDKMVHLDPDQRYQSATEVLKNIENLAHR
ncbi:MAG: protein kinase domain-containing protein, partial [Trichormus sp.]